MTIFGSKIRYLVVPYHINAKILVMFKTIVIIWWMQVQKNIISIFESISNFWHHLLIFFPSADQVVTEATGARIRFGYPVDTIQYLLCEFGMKPRMHLKLNYCKKIFFSSSIYLPETF
jgi:hypothetical protein